ncbi:taurine ABC transporter substrate-binding protein [Mesorhizobium hungaricum]|jgi:taurine transport system substrate-binding protein|uniref:Taurine ABC transporter substrate-binding protein n=1 Tax=Mesorhizobium hungaricum TaxID=1566387 RepID=A0A1C2E776_9HYPH|nr:MULTISPECIES: taurine ABC transporter substrate-binding protein [Mesorhizobium]MDQ0333242.1 taurine transport system substrate-binding protein [Mesorhizobium sp. YL-MeA3-2017]OCX22837.1 taurine ABC transporter substrate-binding protein [Mesorhizobium hungaricum]
MTSIFGKTILLATTAIMVSSSLVQAETLTIATFSDPTPMNAARAQHDFEKATGWTIDWRVFDSGTDVIAAMASGDVKVAELGSSPLAIAATQGVDLKMFMFSYAIGDSESLIARNGSGIETLADIKGKRLAVPVGSTAHFSLMGAIAHAGLQPGDVTVMTMKPDQIAAAWGQGTIDAAFIWPPAQTEILKTGKRIVSAKDTAEWGYPTFNAWTVNSDFLASHEKEVVAFAKAMNAANMAYLKDPAAWTPENEKVKQIASVTGATAEQIPDILKGYTFIPLQEQVTAKWLGNAPMALKATADFLKSAGRIDATADDYSKFVTSTIAQEAAK